MGLTVMDGYLEQAELELLRPLSSFYSLRGFCEPSPDKMGIVSVNMVPVELAATVLAAKCIDQVTHVSCVGLSHFILIKSGHLNIHLLASLGQPWSHGSTSLDLPNC